MVSWREQPTRYDIEALQANIRRVGLVIRVRWVVIVVLVLFSVFGGAMYATRMSVAELASLMWIPALALGFVVLYNTFYAMNYRRLGNIAVWNNLQLGLDALVVTVLVYFSGGANSWFWSMYSLFILEAAFILPRSRDTWSQALLSAVLLGGIELLELLGILPHQSIPFASGEFYQDSVFVAVRFFWQVAVLAGTAGVATLLVGEFRQELEERRAQTILDAATGLLSRGYFTRALPGEIRRAQRDGRPVHLILLDIDRFGDFNARFGFDAGDRLLVALAEVISKVVTPESDIATSNLVARIGGEEFAVLLAESNQAGMPAGEEAASVLAEALRAAVQATRVEGAGVTVSIGVATLPKDGSTAEELMDAADFALGCSIEDGGNRVCFAQQCRDRMAASSASPATDY